LAVVGFFEFAVRFYHDCISPDGADCKKLRKFLSGMDLGPMQIFSSMKKIAWTTQILIPRALPVPLGA
jgi:hypothetical protein